jgi:hypothetical protein
MFLLDFHDFDDVVIECVFMMHRLHVRNMFITYLQQLQHMLSRTIIFVFIFIISSTSCSFFLFFFGVFVLFELWYHNFSQLYSSLIKFS